MVKIDVITKIKFANIQLKYLRTLTLSLIFLILIYLLQKSQYLPLVILNTLLLVVCLKLHLESSTNAEPASPGPVSTDTDAAIVAYIPNTAKSYPKRSRAPVVTFEPPGLKLLLFWLCHSLLIQLYNFIHILVCVII